MKKTAGEVGLVLGLVFVIIGFAYSDSSVWMLGLILGAIGLYERSRKPKEKDR